jgi:hypothetical protein
LRCGGSSIYGLRGGSGCAEVTLTRPAPAEESADRRLGSLAALSRKGEREKVNPYPGLGCGFTAGLSPKRRVKIQWLTSE